MQVAATSELATSATLGGSNTIEFGISNDPAFFQVLSANLYSNQKLAVAREVICNAWDAHIEAGITDTPIRLSILENELVFQDFGLGIAPEDMGRVYGTYGASTKKTNNKVTGGFGLGCKSPFAYTDSFRVTSCHQGVKTIYNVTKSSVESNGKPGITTIASMPTEETGLTVSVPMNPNDEYEFRTYFSCIVMHGEINATLSCARYKDEKLRTLGMSFEPGSYDLSAEWYSNYMGSHSVFIRYGNVIYPMLDTPATSGAFQAIQRFMKIIKTSHIVVQAAPDTMALTPSREALSSQKMTEDGLVDLVTNLVERMESDIQRKIPEFVKTYVAQGNNWNRRSFGTWTSWHDSSYQNIVCLYLSSRLGKPYVDHYSQYMKNQEIKYWVDRVDVGGTSLEAPFKRALVDTYNALGDWAPIHKFRNQYLIKPMLRAIADSEGILSTQSLRLYEYTDYKMLRAKNFMDTDKKNSLHSVTKGILNNLVFASTRLKSIDESIDAYPGYKGHYGESKGDVFIYRVAMKADVRAQEITALRKAGYTVVDLTLNHEWDPMVKKIEKEVKARESRPKVENKFVSLRNAIGKVTLHYGSRYDRKSRIVPGFNTDAAPTWTKGPETPLYFVEVSEVNNSRAGFLGKFGTLSDDILDNCIVARNGIERRMAENRGAISLDRHLILPMLKVLFSKEMKKYITKERKSKYLEYVNIEDETLKLMDMVGAAPSAYLKLKDNPELEGNLAVFKDHSLHTLNAHGIITDEEHTKISEVFTLRPEAPKWTNKVRAIENDDFISNVGVEEMINALEANPERKAAFRSLVLIAIKNGTKSDE